MGLKQMGLERQAQWMEQQTQRMETKWQLGLKQMELERQAQRME